MSGFFVRAALAVAAGFFLSGAQAQPTLVSPPWQGGVNNDVDPGKRGLNFTEAEADNLADFHSSPDNPKLTCHYRWFSAAPLRDGKNALNVNWTGVTIRDAKGKNDPREKTTQGKKRPAPAPAGAFDTSLEVSRENVAEVAASASSGRQ